MNRTLYRIFTYITNTDPKAAAADAKDEALERAARYCDGLAKLYQNKNSGFHAGYTMAAERAARDIRKMKG